VVAGDMKRHVVERRQQDAAIHGVKVHEAFEREVMASWASVPFLGSLGLKRYSRGSRGG